MTERGADAVPARALAGVALVVLAAVAGALTPVSVVACSAAALVALVVYEIRLGLAGQGLARELGDRLEQPIDVVGVVVGDDAGAQGAVGLEAQPARELQRVVVAVPDGDLGARQRARRRRARGARRR